MIVNCDKNTHCILDQMTWCLSCHNRMERPRALHPNTSLWPCRPPCVLHQEPMNGTKCSAANDTEDCVTATWFQLRTGQGLDRLPRSVLAQKSRRTARWNLAALRWSYLSAVPQRPAPDMRKCSGERHSRPSGGGLAGPSKRSQVLANVHRITRTLKMFQDSR